MPAKRRGLALPVMMILVALVVLVGGAIISLGTGSLWTTRHDLSSERAVYAAEAGLAAAADQLYRNGTVPQPFTGQLPNGSYSVTLFSNGGTSPSPGPGGIQLPGSTTYVLATGTCDDGTQRQAGALFRSGLGTFQVGCLANSFSSNNATFDAYNSNLNPPGYHNSDPNPQTLVGNAAIMATNQNSGLPINLANSQVSGGIFVGVGGSTASQISATNTSVQRESVLSQPIPFPSVSVPSLPQGSPPASATPAPSPPPASQWADTNGGIQGPLYVNPPAAPGGNITITHFCLTLQISPTGDFYATEGGSGSTAQGNILANTFSQNAGGNFSVMSFQPFNIHGWYHSAYYDPSSGTFGAEPGPITVYGNSQPTLAYSAAPAWMQAFMSNMIPPSQDNPATLPSGSYQNVTIDSTQTTLQSNSVYVISNLNVTNGGQLALTPNTSNVTVYVTGKLNLSGIDSVINQTGKPPNLRIVYTGTNPVTVSGGAAAFMTLIAPHAAINLNGFGAGFSGAAIGQSVSAVNAVFHYDTATNGVGTGVDATALTLLARYRP